MGHDATKVLLGTTQSSSKEGSETFASSPATYPAGTAVRRASTGLLSVTKADGGWVGVSLGKSLDDALKTTVLRSGLRVPILLTADFEPAIGDPVWIDDVTGKANVEDDGSVTTTVSNAVYASGVMTGVAEDGTEVDVALIDMPGGL